MFEVAVYLIIMIDENMQICIDLTKNKYDIISGMPKNILIVILLF